MTAQYELNVDVCGRPVLQNARMHHYAKAQAVKPWREAGCLLARLAKIPPLGRASVACWGVYPTNVTPDVDAVAPTLKAVLDGIVDAKVLPDDRPPFIQSVTFYEPIVIRGAKPALVVVLTALEADVVHPGRAA